MSTVAISLHHFGIMPFFIGFGIGPRFIGFGIGPFFIGFGIVGFGFVVIGITFFL